MRFVAVVSIALTACVAEDGAWFPGSDPPPAQPPQHLPPVIHLDGLTPTNTSCGWYHCTVAAGGRDRLTVTPVETTFELAGGPFRLERVDGTPDAIALTAISIGTGTAHLDLTVAPTADRS